MIEYIEIIMLLFFFPACLKMPVLWGCGDLHWSVLFLNEFIKNVIVNLFQTEAVY